MQIDLRGHSYKGEPHRTLVNLHFSAIDRLIEKNERALQIYETFSIRRPGDIWKYIWVEVLEIPYVATLSREAEMKEILPWKRHDWPDNHFPLTVFDKFFPYCGPDDTPPEIRDWRIKRNSPEFLKIADREFQRILSAQARLRQSDDLLISSEIALIDSRKHRLDYEAEPYFFSIPPGTATKPNGKYPKSYYEALKALLRNPEIESVAIKCEDDYAANRAVITEQLRRSERLQVKPSAALEVHILADRLDYIFDWGGHAALWQEGLGYGDLCIDVDNTYSMKNVVRYHRRPPKFIFTFEGGGPIAGYRKADSQPGWEIYVRDEAERD